MQSDAFKAIRHAIAGMRNAGTIDIAAMRQLDRFCLVSPPACAPKQIKKLREKNRVSQPVFTRYLNPSESAIEKWEAGAKKPSGMAQKLLPIVETHGLQALE